MDMFIILAVVMISSRMSKLFKFYFRHVPFILGQWYLNKAGEKNPNNHTQPNDTLPHPGISIQSLFSWSIWKERPGQDGTFSWDLALWEPRKEHDLYLHGWIWPLGTWSQSHYFCLSSLINFELPAVKTTNTGPTGSRADWDLYSNSMSVMTVNWLLWKKQRLFWCSR